MTNNSSQLIIEVRFIDREVTHVLLLQTRAERLQGVEIRNGKNNEEIRLVVPLATEIGLCQGKRKGRMNSLCCLQAGSQVRSGNNIQTLPSFGSDSYLGCFASNLRHLYFPPTVDGELSPAQYLTILGTYRQEINVIGSSQGSGWDGVRRERHGKGSRKGG